MAKILVLEDDPDLGELLSTSLEQAGHFPMLCPDATTALAQFLEFEFDLVVADIIVRKNGRPMPDGGLILISRIRNNAEASRRNVPIIAISGAIRNPGMENILTVAQTFGADAELAKPFAPGDLLACINRLLG